MRSRKFSDDQCCSVSFRSAGAAGSDATTLGDQQRLLKALGWKKKAAKRRKSKGGQGCRRPAIGYQQRAVHSSTRQTGATTGRCV